MLYIEIPIDIEETDTICILHAKSLGVKGQGSTFELALDDLKSKLVHELETPSLNDSIHINNSSLDGDIVFLQSMDWDVLLNRILELEPLPGDKESLRKKRVKEQNYISLH